MARPAKLPTGMVKRGYVYHADFRKNGQRIRKRLSSNKEAATVLLNQLRAEEDLREGGVVNNDYPWVNLKAAYLRWASQNVRESTAREYQRALGNFEKYCPVRSVKAITANRIDQYREWRLRDVSARTVNKETIVINSMMTMAVERGLIRANPLAGVKPLPHTAKKVRRSLTADEVVALFRHSPEYLRPVWQMFMQTGIRKGELIEMRWDWIDFASQRITIPARVSKNKKSRQVPISDSMAVTLTRLKELAADREPVKGNSPEATQRQMANFSRDHVFVSQANTPLRNNLLDRFYTICKRAGIEGAEPGGSVDIHALRVSYVSLSIEHGVSPKTVQGIVGHSTLELTMNVYARASDQAKRDAVEALPFSNWTEDKPELRVVDVA